MIYNGEELRALNHDRPPARATRKAVFAFRLWRPRSFRARSTTVKKPVAATNVNKHSADSNKHSADRYVVMGWLNAFSIINKSVTVSQTIVEESIDVLAVSETWHQSSEDVGLRLSVPNGYAITDVPRSTGLRGGGVAIIYRKQMMCSRVTLPPLTTFEAVCVRLTHSNRTVVLLDVYRSGSMRVTSVFFEELSSVFEVLVAQPHPVVVGGDFNIHIEDGNDSDTRQFNELLASFGLTQHVHGPTHRFGGTLDLVLTFPQCTVDHVVVNPADMISDHSLITCHLPLQADFSFVAERLARGWRRADRAVIRRVLQDSPLCRPVPEDSNVDELFDVYEATMRGLADRVAPLHLVRRHVGRLAVWFDNECRMLRRKCRRLDRLYHRTRSPADCLQWVEATRQRFQTYRAKKSAYWLRRLAEDGRSSTRLWRSLSSVMGRGRQTIGVTNLTAEGFARFFEKKVTDVRAATAGSSEPLVAHSSTTSMTSFRRCSQEEVRKIIMSSPVKTCSLDPVPSFLVREFIDLLLPYITDMVNASLHQGRLPSSQKRAIVSPLLKKSGLDAAEMSNYRPVSNLTYMSKLIERVVAKQLDNYLTPNKHLPQCQSGYRKHHSTETALLKVWSDALLAADARQVTLLGLLDLSAAFDCVDHGLLIRRLELNHGLGGKVLGWIQSFLTSRSLQVAYNGELSTVTMVSFGVPQGTVLGPLLFILYTAELSELVNKHGLQLHQYADDCQLYISVPAINATTAVEKFTACLTSIGEWMSSSRLRLNTAKTQVVWLGSRQQLQKVCTREVMTSAPFTVAETARNLGVEFDSELTLSAQVNAVCRSSYYHLRQLRPVARSLTTDAAGTLIHAFISSRLDYCNSLYYGITNRLLQRLQCVQNAAARVLTGTRRRDHISPVLRRLHWLPVRRRIEYKLAMLMHRAQRGQLPLYLADDCRLTTTTVGRSLRSSDVPTFAIPRSRTNFGDRSFRVAGPTVWNSLPAELRARDVSSDQFRKKLKTVLFAKD